jgi:hypothetical protein
LPRNAQQVRAETKAAEHPQPPVSTGLLSWTEFFQAA